MGRKSKLTDAEWASLAKRLADGEKGCALAKAAGISSNALKKHIGSRVHQTKDVAYQIIATQEALNKLPIGAQINAVNLASKLRSTSEHLAGAAEMGAMTAFRMNSIAYTESLKVNDKNPLESVDKLKNVSASIEIANRAASVGLNLLAANKDFLAKNPSSGDLTQSQKIERLKKILASAEERGGK